MAQSRAGRQRQLVHLPEDVETYGLPEHVGHFFRQKLHQQAEQGADFLLGAVPVFAGKGVQRQIRDAQRAAFGDDAPRRRDPGPMSRGAGQTLPLRPSAVAIHDDGHMLRKLLRHADQISMISFSLPWQRLSASATYLSVSFCTSSLAFFNSSSEMTLSFSSFLS